VNCAMLMRCGPRVRCGFFDPPAVAQPAASAAPAAAGTLTWPRAHLGTVLCPKPTRSRACAEAATHINQACVLCSVDPHITQRQEAPPCSTQNDRESCPLHKTNPAHLLAGGDVAGLAAALKLQAAELVHAQRLSKRNRL